MHEEVVLTHNMVQWNRLWWKTIRLARGQPNIRAATGVERLKVRCNSLLKIRSPVFILGCPRSGTTHLGNILAEIPGASYYFEPPIMKYFTRLVYEGGVSEARALNFYQQAVRRLLLMAPGRGKCFIEKNPKHTWVAETILKAFPDAKFVIISRDGRDVALSLSEKPWHLRESLAHWRREPGGYLYGPYPHFYIEPNRSQEYIETNDMHRCIWIWRRYAEQIEYLKGKLPRNSQFHISYENLVCEPSETLKATLDFLDVQDLSVRESVFRFAALGRRSSAGRWRRGLTREDLAIIGDEASQLLERLGYSTRLHEPKHA